MPGSLHVHPGRSYRFAVRILAVAVLALALAPAALAQAPPPSFQVIFPRQVIQISAPGKAHRQQSCTAGKPNSKSKARKAIAACEQPPRANVNGLTGTIFASARP
jgi:opacity protein-like surface antigen